VRAYCVPGARLQVRDGVRVVVAGELLKPAVPDAVADDWQMDAWLQALQPSPRSDASHEYSIYLLPAGRHGAFRVEDGSRRLMMGTGMTGWMLVSPDETKLMRSIEGLPKTLAGVLRGEDKDVSSALVESSAAGARVSASSARFSGELEAREVGQRSSLRVTLTLLVGCSADAPNASAARHQPRAIPTAGSLQVEDVRSATHVAADCARGPVTWEAEEAMESMVLPLAQRLNETYSISLDSQVLHYADLAVAPVWNPEREAHVLKSNTLNDFINWQNWPLDSTTSLTRTVHLLLYLPSRHVSPLLLLDPKSEPLSPPALMVTGYGAAYVLPDHSLLSPPLSTTGGAHITQAHLRAPLAALVGQLRNMLGLETPPGVRSLPDYASGAPLWQLRTMQVSLFRVCVRSCVSVFVCVGGVLADCLCVWKGGGENRKHERAWGTSERVCAAPSLSGARLVRTSARSRAHEHTRTHTYTHVHTRTHTCTHVHARTCTYMHLHTRTHKTKHSDG
jgi:hypothetical protein